MAVSHKSRDHETVKEVCYIDVVVFSKVGERTKAHLHKGSRVLIDGRLTQRRWETPQGKIKKQA